MREWRVPTALAGPTGLAIGPDHAVWFTEAGANAIGRLAGGVITEYPLPHGGTPTAITAGPDGALWFTESGASRLGRIAPDGSITEYPVPVCAGCSDGSQSDIAVGPDGALWFTSTYGNAIGRMNVRGQARWFRLSSARRHPSRSRPDRTGLCGQYPDTISGVAVKPDGSVWFAEEAANRIGRLIP